MKLNLENGISNAFKPVLIAFISIALFSGLGAAQDPGRGEVIVLDDEDNEIDVSPYEEISTALSNTEQGYTVSVGPGDYDETLDVPIGVTVEGPYSETPADTDSRGQEEAIINGVSNMNEGSVFTGFTVEGSIKIKSQ